MSNTSNTQAETLTVRRAAQMLGMSRMGVYRAVRRGEIKATRIGSRILILKRPLLRRLELNSEVEK